LAVSQPPVNVLATGGVSRLTRGANATSRCVSCLTARGHQHAGDLGDRVRFGRLFLAHAKRRRAKRIAKNRATPNTSTGIR
jgi:hypothetical protein